MKFKFPVVIIDEDFRSENTSGFGIRALADAIDAQGIEVLGLTSFGDLTQFAQQQSRASAFVLSIDDEEFGDGSPEEMENALKNIRAFISAIRLRNNEIPIYLYGETRTSKHIPNDVLREMHGFIHMFEDTPEFVARHIIREARSYMDSLPPPFFSLPPLFSSPPLLSSSLRPPSASLPSPDGTDVEGIWLQHTELLPFLSSTLLPVVPAVAATWLACTNAFARAAR